MRFFVRACAVLGIVAVCVAAVADVRFFFGFTRYYFPEAPTWRVFVHFLVWFPALIYFAAVLFAARWAPWRPGAPNQTTLS
jgi:hypothetical protein